MNRCDSKFRFNVVSEVESAALNYTSMTNCVGIYYGAVAFYRDLTRITVSDICKPYPVSTTSTTSTYRGLGHSITRLAEPEKNENNHAQFYGKLSLISLTIFHDNVCI